MHRIIARIVPLALSAVLLGGCSERSVVVYEPAIEMADLAAGLTAPDNTYKLLSDEQTTGRFACAVAVAKLTLREEQDDYRLDFVPLRPNEQAYWCEQVRGLTAIRELVFLTPASTRLHGQDFEGLCAAAKPLGAALLLLYAPNGLGPNSAQVFGVLYDVGTREPLATLHASSIILDDNDEEVSPNGERGDHRDIDARYQAQRSFEGHLLACLRELIQRDMPPATTQPHQWDTPLIERWWVPVRRR